MANKGIKSSSSSSSSKKHGGAMEREEKGKKKKFVKEVPGIYIWICMYIGGLRSGFSCMIRHFQKPTHFPPPGAPG